MYGDGFDRARALLEPFRFGFPKITIGIATFQGPDVFTAIDHDVFSTPDEALQHKVRDTIVAIARRGLPASAARIQFEGIGITALARGESYYDRYVLGERRTDLKLLTTAAMYAGNELPLPASQIYWTYPDDPSITDDWQCEYELRWYLKVLDDGRFSSRPPEDFGASVEVRVCDDVFAATWTLLDELLKPQGPPRPEPHDDEEREVIELIRSVGHRLTTTQLLSEFGQRGQIKAESTVKLKLSRMVAAGLLTNRQDVRPHKGYGLPEWD
jgi:hypothetical protein